jgi:hypothetical protein
MSNGHQIRGEGPAVTNALVSWNLDGVLLDNPTLWKLALVLVLGPCQSLPAPSEHMCRGLEMKLGFLVELAMGTTSHQMVTICDDLLSLMPQLSPCSLRTWGTWPEMEISLTEHCMMSPTQGYQLQIKLPATHP